MTVQAGKQNNSVKMSGFPGLFLYGSQWKDRTQTFPKTEQREGKYKAEVHVKNKQKGQGSVKCPHTGFCNGSL